MGFSPDVLLKNCDLRIRNDITESSDLHLTKGIGIVLEMRCNSQNHICFERRVSIFIANKFNCFLE